MLLPKNVAVELFVCQKGKYISINIARLLTFIDKNPRFKSDPGTFIHSLACASLIVEDPTAGSCGYGLWERNSPQLTPIKKDMITLCTLGLIENLKLRDLAATDFDERLEHLAGRYQFLKSFLPLQIIFEKLITDSGWMTEPRIVQRRLWCVFQELLKMRLNIKVLSHDGTSLLMRAIIARNSTAVAFLIFSGAEIMHLSQLGQTPLSLVACGKGVEYNFMSRAMRRAMFSVFSSKISVLVSYDMLRSILPALSKAQINMSNESKNVKIRLAHFASPGYESALSAAIFHNKFENAISLIAYGADINAVIHSTSASSALHWACMIFAEIYAPRSVSRDHPDAIWRSQFWQDLDSHGERFTQSVSRFYVFIHDLLAFYASTDVKDNVSRSPLDYLTPAMKSFLFFPNKHSDAPPFHREAAKELEKTYNKDRLATSKTGTQPLGKFFRAREVGERIRRRRRRRVSVSSLQMQARI